tara:strand:+ start:54 stop:575 length:522 start_codon:yes stop_codon:yes gene_type:complete
MGQRLIITEEERGSISSMYDIINEQKMIPLLTILKNPLKVNLSAKDNSNIIYLTQRDKDVPNRKKVKYLYKISGEYDAGLLMPTISFDVKLRKVKRLVSGTLMAEVQPSNSVVNLAMKTFIPKESLTSDGWLSLRVPPDKVNDSIRDLKSGGGNSSVLNIDEAPQLKILITKI